MCAFILALSLAHPSHPAFRLALPLPTSHLPFPLPPRCQAWRLLRANGAPTNPLHERGFVSIGCEPCTRPVLPHQHEREGR